MVHELHRFFFILSAYGKVYYIGVKRVLTPVTHERPMFSFCWKRAWVVFWRDFFKGGGINEI